MARMHSRRRGKSKSKKPISAKQPVWVRYSDKEVEMLIEKLAKKEKTTAQIGTILRDTYGIPDVSQITKKKISKILQEKKLSPEIPQDLLDLIKKDVKLEEHREENKHDKTAKRGSILTESKIKRLVKYYKAKKVLPENWKYSRKQAKLLIS